MHTVILGDFRFLSHLKVRKRLDPTSALPSLCECRSSVWYPDGWGGEKICRLIESNPAISCAWVGALLHTLHIRQWYLH